MGLPAGEDEGLREAAAACLGAFAQSCTLEELQATLQEAAFSGVGGAHGQRLGAALTLAAVAKHAAPRRAMLNPGTKPTGLKRPSSQLLSLVL